MTPEAFASVARKALDNLEKADVLLSNHLVDLRAEARLRVSFARALLEGAVEIALAGADLRSEGLADLRAELQGLPSPSTVSAYLDPPGVEPTEAEIAAVADLLSEDAGDD